MTYLQVNHGAGGEHVDAQVQLLPLHTGLAHCGLGLLTFAVQWMKLFGLRIQAHGGLCEDSGHLGMEGKRRGCRR